MSLARITIGYEWRRYIVAIFIIGLIGVLFYAQIGLVKANWYSLGAVERELNADIIVADVPKKGRRFFPRLPGVSGAVVSAENLYIHPNIKTAEFHHFRILSNRGRRNSTEEVKIDAVMVDTNPSSMSYLKTLPPQARPILNIPGNALVSKSLARQLKLSHKSSFQFLQQKLNVAGIFSAPFDTRVDIILSKKTSELLYPLDSRGAAFGSGVILLKLKNAAKRTQTIAELSAWLKPRGLQVLRPEEYTVDVSLSMLKNSRQIQSVFAVALFALFISIIVTAQTLRSAVAALRTQFGTMRALGISGWRMSMLTMELALWVGILGSVLAMASGFVLQAVFSRFNLPMMITWDVVVFASLSLVSIALIGGLSCLRFVFSIKPVELLR